MSKKQEAIRNYHAAQKSQFTGLKVVDHEFDGFWAVMYVKELSAGPHGRQDLVIDVGEIVGKKFYGTKGNKLITGKLIRLLNRIPDNAAKMLIDKYGTTEV